MNVCLRLCKRSSCIFSRRLSVPVDTLVAMVSKMVRRNARLKSSVKLISENRKRKNFSPQRKEKLIVRDLNNFLGNFGQVVLKHYRGIFTFLFGISFSYTRKAPLSNSGFK